MSRDEGVGAAPPLGRAPTRAVSTSLVSTAILCDAGRGERDQTCCATVAVFDWRAANRVSENADELTGIDHALTATGLAAEIRALLRRLP